VCLTGACGGTTPHDQGALGSTVAPTPSTSVLDTPTPSPTTTTLTPSPTPTHTPTPTPTSGDGGDDGSAAPATRGGGVCGKLEPVEVGKVLGVVVSGAAVPGQTGCTFRQGGEHGMAVTVLDKSTARAGGMAGAKSEANSAVEGDPEDVPGIGSAAFVITGTMFGEPEINGAGAVQVGARIISVYLAEGSGLTADKVRALELDLLRLVARRAG